MRWAWLSLLLGEAVSLSLQPKPSQTPVPAIIWIYWEQGWQNAPLLCQICSKSWEQNNPKAQVRKLSKDDLGAVLPELSAWPRLWQVPPQQRSDLIRLFLLTRYGGIWADATVFSAAPIMPWLQRLRQTSNEFFFVFDRSDSDQWASDPFLDQHLFFSSWFIASSPGHPLMVQWRDELREMASAETIFYFGVQLALSHVLKARGPQQVFHQMPKVSAQCPHRMEFELGFATPASHSVRDVLQSCLQVAPMMKLSWKVLQDDFVAKLLRAKPSSFSTLLSMSSFNSSEELGPSSDTQPSLAELAAEERELSKHVRDNWTTSFHIPRLLL